jgi:hypothetical protein
MLFWLTFGGRGRRGCSRCHDFFGPLPMPLFPRHDDLQERGDRIVRLVVAITTTVAVHPRLV